MGVRVLVTGGSGFVGANLTRRLLNLGHEVHLLTRPDSSLWRVDPILGDVRIHQVSETDGAKARAVVRNVRPDWTFHLAAHGANPNQLDASRILSTNLHLTMALVEACIRAGVGLFVNAGSSAEYGPKDHAPSEEEAADPVSFYGVTKSAATLYVGYMARHHRANLLTLRLYSVFGPYEDGRRLLPRIMLMGAEGRLPPLARPHLAHDFVYVEDVVDAFLLAAEAPSVNPGAIYNVGTGVQTSLQEVVDLARRTFGFSEEPHWGSTPDREWDSSVWVADTRKIRGQFGWRPAYTFEEGFLQMVDWFRGNAGLYLQEGATL